MHEDSDQSNVMRPLRASPADALLNMQRTMWLSILEGAFTMPFLAWTMGSMLTGYLMALGAGPRELAAAASLPLLASTLIPFVAFLAMRARSRTKVIAFSALLGRGIWLLAALLPLIPVSTITRLNLLLGIIAFSSLAQGAAGTTWISLMADNVHEEIRGKYFGFRGALMGLVSMVSVLGAGWYVDRVPSPGGFQMVFIVGLLLAMVGMRLYTSHYDPVRPPATASLSGFLTAPFQDKAFRRLALFTMYWQFSIMLASPFVIPYFLNHLGMSYTQVAIWTAIASVCGLFTGPLWGRLSDHVGHKAVVSATMLVAGSLHPLCWMLASPGRFLFIWISGIVDAFSWGGLNAALFNLSIQRAPRASRESYFAVLGLLNGAAGFLGGLLSGRLLEWLQQHEGALGSYYWTGFHSLFVLSALFRLSAWWVLRLVPDDRGGSPVDVVRALRRWGSTHLDRMFTRDAR